MQPGRPFLRSLQTTFLRHIKGKVHHAEDGPFRLGRRFSQRCTRPERVDSDPRQAPLERTDIVNRVLAAVKSCTGVDSAKVVTCLLSGWILPNSLVDFSSYLHVS